MTNSNFLKFPRYPGVVGVFLLLVCAAGCDRNEKINVNTPKGRVLEFYKEDIMGDTTQFDPDYAVDSEVARRYSSDTGRNLGRRLLAPYKLSVADAIERGVELIPNDNEADKIHHFSVDVNGKARGRDHAPRERILTAWVDCIELDPSFTHYPPIVPGEYMECTLVRLELARCGNASTGVEKWLENTRTRLGTANIGIKFEDHAFRDRAHRDYVDVPVQLRSLDGGEFPASLGVSFGGYGSLRCFYDPADLCRSDCVDSGLFTEAH